MTIIIYSVLLLTVYFTLQHFARWLLDISGCVTLLWALIVYVSDPSSVTWAYFGFGLASFIFLLANRRTIVIGIIIVSLALFYSYPSGDACWSWFCGLVSPVFIIIITVYRLVTAGKEFVFIRFSCFMAQWHLLKAFIGILPELCAVLSSFWLFKKAIRAAQKASKSAFSERGQ
jgi:hypothetical protein